MTILVTDQGFGPDTWDRGYTPLGEAANDAVALDVPADARTPIQVPLTAQIIRVDFPGFADGRGFTIARMLRLRGYQWSACARTGSCHFRSIRHGAPRGL